MPAHQIDDGGLIQAKLRFNRLEGGAVLPSHLHNARDVGIGEGQRAGGPALLGMGHRVRRYQFLTPAAPFAQFLMRS